MAKQKSILVLVVVLSCASICFGKYSGGDGSPENPYKIATAEDMNQIGANPDDWGAHFELVNDINLADYTGTQFNIIGYYESYNSPNNAPFTGVFDGNSHTISNFTYSTTDNSRIGLFRYVDDANANAEIKDLTLIDPNVNAESPSRYVGSLVGWFERGSISSCGIEGGSVSGDQYIGGLVGYSSHVWISKISNCYAAASVSGSSRIGGLIGYTSAGDTISNCYATGSVSGSCLVGGLVGDNWGSRISNCYATASVSGTSNYVGGLVGVNGGWISNSYATGSVSGGNNDTGGLVGGNGGGISNSYATGSVLGTGDYTGGLVGSNDCSGTISNCYATGSVLGGNYYTGGLVGYNCNFCDPDVGECWWGIVLASFWDIETTGQSSSDGGEGKTTAEMQTRSTFTDAGWDFIEIWNIGENQTYPFLRTHPAGDINHDDIVNFYDLAILAEHWLQSID